MKFEGNNPISATGKEHRNPWLYLCNPSGVGTIKSILQGISPIPFRECRGAQLPAMIRRGWGWADKDNRSQIENFAFKDNFIINKST
jgi:hypothetical protein